MKLKPVISSGPQDAGAKSLPFGPTLLLCLALVFAAPVAGANHYPDPVFLTTGSLSRATVLPPPPSRGSAADRADFREILARQNSRTPAEVARAAAVVEPSLATLFGPPEGPLTSKEVALWSAFFERVRIDTDYFVQETKKQWGRKRPYVNHRRVKPCVRREWTNAYPSGHAAISRTFARVLSVLDPSRRDGFRARAELIGADRVLAGVHHPSDIVAGQLLGDRVFEALWVKASFRRELRAVAGLDVADQLHVWVREKFLELWHLAQISDPF